MAVPTNQVREVRWVLPRSLYSALQSLQESIRGSDLSLKWGSVEAMAVDFLGIAVREVGKELRQKAESERLVQLPGQIIQP